MHACRQQHACSAPRSHQPLLLCNLQLGQYGGFHEELETLKRDKNVLMLELVRLRQAQQNSDLKVRELQQRAEQTEQRQQTIISFFTAALKNPQMLSRLFTQVNAGGVQRISATKTGARPN
jgi:heat shock transcription factor